MAALSKDTGGGGSLGGRKGTAVENKLKDADQAAAAKQTAASAGGGKGSRTDEELKRVLDAAKARITAVYYRALDDDPTLQGRMVFKLTIDPSGSVSNVQVVSSALKNDDLQRKITALLRGLNFGARMWRCIRRRCRLICFRLDLFVVLLGRFERPFFVGQLLSGHLFCRLYRSKQAFITGYKPLVGLCKPTSGL